MLYLFLGVFGGFAQGFLYPKLYVAGDAVATTANLTANSELARFGIVADLLGQTFFVLLALTLYVLLKNVHQGVARAMVVLVVLAAAVTCLNVVFEFEGLQIATGAVDASSLGVSGSNSLVLMMLDAQHYGIFVAQLFFGLWLTPLAYLANKSGMFPKPLGIVLVLATVSYLLDVLVAFLLPEASAGLHGFFSVVPAVAEIGMVLFLLIFGVLTPKAVTHGKRVLVQQ
ncbi:DUF4386 domain-containing protein [Frigoribacterium sp. UYMn621]|uniref:DUF4386 domain-containing protein n=1 Tax=Frigoribacterium sp. UYMn621 TaxID=3156343 RepID=UPI003395999D